MLANGKELPLRHIKPLETIKKLYVQQHYMYANTTHKVEDYIVSLSQPWICPIVRDNV